jgi:hypothetical protein
MEFPCRIAEAKTSSSYPVTANHRCVAEVAVLSQARVPPSQVVETDSETDWPPPSGAIPVSAPTQPCRLAERTDGSVERSVPLYQEAADLNVTTHDDRSRLRRRRRRSKASRDQSDCGGNAYASHAAQHPLGTVCHDQRWRFISVFGADGNTQTCARTVRVPACLRRVRFVAVRCKKKLFSLQGVSVC